MGACAFLASGLDLIGRTSAPGPVSVMGPLGRSDRRFSSGIGVDVIAIACFIRGARRENKSGAKCGLRSGRRLLCLGPSTFFASRFGEPIDEAVSVRPVNALALGRHDLDSAWLQTLIQLTGSETGAVVASAWNGFSRRSKVFAPADGWQCVGVGRGPMRCVVSKTRSGRTGSIEAWRPVHAPGAGVGFLTLGGA